MPKVYLVSFSLELDDDAPHPNEEELVTAAAHAITGITGIGNFVFEEASFSTLEEDPTNHILH